MFGASSCREPLVARVRRRHGSDRRIALASDRTATRPKTSEELTEPRPGVGRCLNCESRVYLISDVVSCWHGLRDDASGYERERWPFPTRAGKAGGHVPSGRQLLRERHGFAFG